MMAEPKAVTQPEWDDDLHYRQEVLGGAPIEAFGEEEAAVVFAAGRPLDQILHEVSRIAATASSSCGGYPT